MTTNQERGAPYLASTDYDITTSRNISNALIHCSFMLQLFRTHDIGPGEISGCMFLTGTVLQALASLAPPDQDDADPLYTAAQQDQFQGRRWFSSHQKKTLPQVAWVLDPCHCFMVWSTSCVPDDQQDFFKDQRMPAEHWFLRSRKECVQHLLSSSG